MPVRFTWTPRILAVALAALIAWVPAARFACDIACESSRAPLAATPEVPSCHAHQPQAPRPVSRDRCTHLHGGGQALVRTADASPQPFGIAFVRTRPPFASRLLMARTRGVGDTTPPGIVDALRAPLRI